MADARKQHYLQGLQHIKPALKLSLGSNVSVSENKSCFFFCSPVEQEFSLVLMMSFVATWCSDTDGGMGRVVCDHGVLTVFKVAEQDPAGSQRGGQH